MDDLIMKRALPHSLEAERAVIGSMLLDRDAIIASTEVLQSKDFYNRMYGVLYEAVATLHAEGSPVDMTTVQNRLAQMDVPPEADAVEILREIVMSMPTVTNIQYYVSIVNEKAMLRKMIKLNEDIANACFASKEKSEIIFEKAEKDLFEILNSRKTRDTTSIAEIMINVMTNIEKVAKSKTHITGIATGFKQLDYYTAGLQNSDLILLAARPSMGKTAFVLNLAHNIAVRKQNTTAIFSLEMSKEQLVNRLLAMESMVDTQKIKTGDLTTQDWIMISESAAIIGTSQLIVDDTPGITLSELRSKCRRMKIENDLKLIIIDYLQLMSGNAGRSDSRQQEITEISRGLKILARELDVPVIALSQLSRACETRPDHRPILSDLRESGAIEQDADIVMFLYRDEYYNKDNDENKGTAELIIAKQRNGSIGTVDLLWQAAQTRFVNAEYERR